MKQAIVTTFFFLGLGANAMATTKQECLALSKQKVADLVTYYANLTMIAEDALVRENSVDKFYQAGVVNGLEQAFRNNLEKQIESFCERVILKK